MQSVLLDTPDGIRARLGWDPRMEVHDRKRALARQLVAERMHVDEKDVLITRQAPAQFGFHTQLWASVDGAELPVQIKSTSFRGATVAAIAEPGIRFGLDLRDLQPDESVVSEMRRHSHLLPTEELPGLIAHWTRVQAVREADGRGTRVQPEHVRLDSPRKQGWVPDRHVTYKLTDLSRDAWVITLAHTIEEAA